MSTMEPAVLYEPSGVIGYVTLNRPHVLNAMNDEWIHALVAAAQTAHEDAAARVIVIRGRRSEGNPAAPGADGALAHAHWPRAGNRAPLPPPRQAAHRTSPWLRGG